MLCTNGNEFRQAVKGENFMTPNVYDYYLTGNYHVEVSNGYWRDDKIWGVTVVNGETMEHDPDKSQMFTSKKEAMQYVEDLGNE